MERLGLGVDDADVAQPAPDLRLDLRLRRRPVRGSTAGRTRRSSRPRPASPSCRATPAAATTPTTRSATPTRTPRIELTTAILAALYQREHDGRRPGRSTCRWPRRCCSSTTTCTTSCGTATRTRTAIRNFGPGDYIVFGPADGDRRDHQRPSGRAGHVRPVPAGVRDPRARRRPALRRRRQSRWRNVAELRADPARRRAEIPDGRRSRRSAARNNSPSAACAAAATSPTPSGPPSAARWRGLRPRRRHDPHPQPAVALQRRRGRPAAAGRSTAARTTATCSPTLLGYDDATIDGLEADGVLSSRVPSSAV